MKDDTLGLSKMKALKHVPGSATCDPMDTVLMLGYNNLETWATNARIQEQNGPLRIRRTCWSVRMAMASASMSTASAMAMVSTMSAAPRFAPESKN